MRRMQKGRHVDSLIERGRAGAGVEGGGKGSAIFGIALRRFAPVGSGESSRPVPPAAELPSLLWEKSGRGLSDVHP